MRQRKQVFHKSSLNGQVPSTKHISGIEDTSEDKVLEDTARNGNPSNSVDQKATRPVANDSVGGSKICCINLAGVLRAILLVCVVPPFLNYASLQKESRSLRPAGEMQILPQGHKLFINCSGRGLPVVILDNPAGFSSDVWALVQPTVAEFTKVCIYDRAGIGFSESLRIYTDQRNDTKSHGGDVTGKRLLPTVENMAADLQFLLRTVANNSNAVILVGGGLGALNTRFYARLYGNVSGLVLVNSFYEDMFTEIAWTKFWYEQFIPSVQIQHALASLGLTRLGLLSGFVKPDVLQDKRLSDDVKTRLKYLMCNSEHLTSGISEHFYVNESLIQLKILRKLKQFPENVFVTVISSQKFSSRLEVSLNDFWRKSQEMLMSEMSPLSERILVNGDFHTVYLNDAPIIVKTIKNLVKKFRKSVKQSASM